MPPSEILLELLLERRRRGSSRPIGKLFAIILMACVQSKADDQLFETEIRPVLVKQCFKCHGGESTSGGLRVDSLAALLKGGEGGPAIIPGQPEKSRLLKAIGYRDEDFQMPPDAPLPARVVSRFRQWIEQGARWPETSKPQDFAGERHWAFHAPQRPQLPRINSTAIQTPVDLFILERLRAAGLEFSPRADGQTLSRRLAFDLHGLPAAESSLRMLQASARPDAVSEEINRLLASPRYGERWARHWLDVARYSDTKGYVFQEDRNYPFAYTYRDWVIESLNQDLPYDRFLVAQIAADLIEDAEPSLQRALGFLTLGRRFLNNRHDIIDDRIDVVTRGTMGLTVACARCHDHKYDPIPTADYYSLYGVFASSRIPSELPNAMVLVEAAQPVNPTIFERGSPGRRGASVPRQFLELIAGPDRTPFENGSGRLEMAREIASPNNPLTARVIANRVWMHHFHQPLVRTPSDFGLRSDPPTHPELLDYLACELIDSGWSLKHLHRLILNSRTWQQSSQMNHGGDSQDSANQLYWRMNRYRLDFEAMRDGLLSVSGALDQTMYGEPVEIAADSVNGRRSLYGRIDRQNLPALFRTFDFATPDAHSPGRFETSVPQQTLYLRNSPFLSELARRLARRAGQVHETASAEWITRLYTMTIQREPTESELALCLDFLSDHSTGIADPRPSDLAVFGFGDVDPDTGTVTSFQPLPHWTGSVWQGGQKLPDPRLGWVSIRRDGGHPGNPTHAWMVRWTVPETGSLTLNGMLRNPSEQGDGVKALIISDRSGRIGNWSINHGQIPTELAGISVAAGETIDLVIHCGQNESHDSFLWNPVLTLKSQQGERSSWSLLRDFSGPAPSAMTLPEQLAQVLLMSNEFLFVD